jgi:hypothetical protein
VNQKKDFLSFPLPSSFLHLFFLFFLIIDFSIESLKCDSSSKQDVKSYPLITPRILLNLRNREQKIFCLQPLQDINLGQVVLFDNTQASTSPSFQPTSTISLSNGFYL